VRSKIGGRISALGLSLASDQCGAMRLSALRCGSGRGNLSGTHFDGSSSNHVTFSGARTTRSANLCRVLAEDSELAQAVSLPQRSVAVERCLAPAMTLPRGAWDASGVTISQSGIGLLVMGGLLIRRVGIGEWFAAELLGQGDLLRPWQGKSAKTWISRTTDWRILEQARVAVLDEQVAVSLAMYPELIGRLVGRALERSRNLATSLAIAQQTRVNLRLCLLFWHLADRWGRVGAGGVLVPMRLTHSCLAELVCARRPSVSAAVSQLCRQGVAHQVRDGWLLRGEPPRERLQLQQAGIPEDEYQADDI
jgi:CRP/FNR family transcriptional regulator, cyclic AMP receptor protein